MGSHAAMATWETGPPMRPGDKLPLQAMSQPPLECGHACMLCLRWNGTQQLHLDSCLGSLMQQHLGGLAFCRACSVELWSAPPSTMTSLRPWTAHSLPAGCRPWSAPHHLLCAASTLPRLLSMWIHMHAAAFACMPPSVRLWHIACLHHPSPCHQRRIRTPCSTPSH